MPQKGVESSDDDDGLILYGGDYPYPPLTENIGQTFLDAMFENADRIAQVSD